MDAATPAPALPAEPAASAPGALATPTAEAAASANSTNPFERLSEASPPKAAQAAAQARPSPRPAPGSTNAKPTATPTTAQLSSPTRDRDAELVAALIANADAGREVTLPASGTQPAAGLPVSAADRNRLAGELRSCQQRHASNTAARDACRADACQSHGMTGRIKSCPAVGTRADSSNSPAGPRA
ncbi:hypothetical protein [Roseateles sp. BYS87W]|uniref:Uncharacterized protein n=1 Tax=Pelomonas baiyunensis TaxID=3299026 RepID=A0ABW7H4C3_9BURK